jgi:hypothetical protein
MVIPMSEFAADGEIGDLHNLRREVWPPYYDAPPALALDRRLRSRRSS